MMPGLAAFLLMYGLCFGLMNKLPDFFYGLPGIGSLLSCAYCTGFHCGWLVWLLDQASTQSWPDGIAGWLAVPMWALSGAAFCYAMETTLNLAESRTLTEDGED